jgi:hypothetical protein
MAKKTQFEQSRFYFNEYRRFPLEMLFIPILIAAAIVGLYFGTKAFLRWRGPASAAEQIMGHLQAEDATELTQYIKFTPEQRERMDFGGGTEQQAKSIISDFRASGFTIESFAAIEAPYKGSKATVPIDITVRSLKDGSTRTVRISLPLERVSARWRFTTADMRRVLGLPAGY